MSEHRLPPLNALRAFDAVVRTGSMAQAAAHLSVTPGAVSQQIRLLEDHVGGPLFDREGRTLTLTEAGRLGAPRVRAAFEELEKAVANMRPSSRRHRLTISVAPSFAGKWLAPRLYRFQEAHPEVEVWISADSTRVDLNEGGVDLAIRYAPEGEALAGAVKLLREEVLPVCSPELLKAGPLRQPQDLAGHTLLHDASPESEVDGADWATWLRSRRVKGVSVRGGPRFNQSALVIDAAVAGRGIALAKRTLAEGDLRSGRLVSLFPDGAAPVRSAYFVLRPLAQAKEESGAAFLAWLQQEARNAAARLDEL